MAYLSNEEEENTGVGMNVLNPAQEAQNGASGPITPQSPAGTPPVESQGSTSQSQAPGAVQAGASSPNTPASAPSSRKTQPKASSGTFTNIRKYVEANKPAAQKMTQQVTKQFGGQAQNLQKDAQRRAEMFGSQVQQRQNLLQDERQAAQDVTSQVLGQQGAESPFTEDQYGRVRDVITGNKQFEDVQDLNLANEQNKAATLQRQADSASTEAGRASLLKQTFGSGARDYTRGQQGLDALVLQGDEAARKGLIEGIGQQAQTTTQNVNDLRKQALQNVAQYRQDRSGIGQSLADIIQSQGADVLSGQIDDKVAAEMSRRQELADQLGVASGDLDQFIKDTGANLNPADVTGEFQTRFIRDGYREGLMRSQLAEGQVDPLVLDALNRNLSETGANAWLNTERQRFDSQIGGVKAQAQANAQRFAQDLQQERDQTAMDEALGRLYGKAEEGRGLEDLNRLRSGEDLSRATTVQDEDVARYTALQDLLQGRNIGEREFTSGATQTGAAQKETESLQGFYQNLQDRLAKARGQ